MRGSGIPHLSAALELPLAFAASRGHDYTHVSYYSIMKLAPSGARAISYYRTYMNKTTKLSAYTLFLLFSTSVAFVPTAAFAESAYVQCRRQCADQFNEAIQTTCKNLEGVEQIECDRRTNNAWEECQSSCERLQRQPSVSQSLTNFGGRIFYVSQCVIEDPVLEPTVCHTCPVCTSLFGPGCAAVTEVQFTPAPGSAWNTICPLKGFPYKRGFPTVGGQLLGNGFSQSAIKEAGVSGITRPRVSRGSETLGTPLIGLLQFLNSVFTSFRL